MSTFFIGLDSWIIQDGNYADFHRGNVATFAVEFYPERAAISRVRKASFERIKGSRYRINAKVVFASPQAWVLDFGIMAYNQQGTPPFAKVGTWIEGDFYLGIDPFFYFEELNELPGMPAMQYDWRIERILLETTPWISTKRPEGGTLMERDKTKESFREVERTNAWEDDEGRGSYELECEKVGK
jgi:hypothetical protein